MEAVWGGAAQVSGVLNARWAQVQGADRRQLLPHYNQPTGHESQFYNVMIQCACDVKQSENLASFFEYLDLQLESNPRLWLLLSMAYNIQNLYYLDYEWASKKVKQIISSTASIKNYIVVLICRKMKYIVKEISDILVEENLITNVIESFTEKSRNVYQYRYDIMQYAVSAYQFGQITESNFTSFIEALKPSDFNSLFGCIISEKNGELLRVLLAHATWATRMTPPKEWFPV